MLDLLLWWLVLELIGLAGLPIAFRLFPNLPERGYAFIKPLGLLLIAYPFWLLTSLGFLVNTRGVITLVALAVAGIAWLVIRHPPSAINQAPEDNASHNPQHVSLVDWLQANKPIVLTTELIFTGAFLSWVFVRAYMPEIQWTEKPMEFAFLNGVLQSEHFPPLDPWLSGYAISYYYFGYVIVGMLTMLTDIPASITFNLAIATLFALGATGAYGLAYNLIHLSPLAERKASASFFAIFAPIFLVIIGNLEAIFEVLHNRGIGSPEFWSWLDVKGLTDVPPSGTWIPTDTWWWWRASRVIHDVIGGNTVEVIDEFPQFSFLLGDMHPHVLALPFVLLALAVALNLLNTKFSRSSVNLGFGIWDWGFGIFPLILGGLFFLNSWDILPYGFILLAAFAVARYRVEHRWDNHAWRDLIIFTITLGVTSILLYLPFFIGFQSQAGGILPTLFVKTRLHQYLLMFGIFVFILGVFIVKLAREHRELNLRAWIANALPFIAAALAFPLIVAALAISVLALTPALQDQVRAVLPGASGNVLTQVIGAYFAPWFSDPWLFILLALFLAALAVLIRARIDEPATVFALIAAFTAFLLTFGVEFVYLRDQFGSRMNTVFKFYFQAWTLFSIVATYAVFYLSLKLAGFWRGVWFSALGVLLAASLIYPALAIPNRADAFQRAPTLDGLAWLAAANPSDYAAIQWLNENAPRGATIVEAPGDEYSYGNRISMATGLPTVLGWALHENQWRGNMNLFANPEAGIDRAGDVRRLYQTLDAQELLTLLTKYDIKFVIVGQSEKNQYGLAKSQIDKFAKVMELAFEAGDVKIFAR